METPEILWAQSREKLFMTVKIQNLQESNIEILQDTINIRGISNLTKINLELNLFKKILVDESYWELKENSVEITMKKNGDFFWNKLFLEKYGNLRIDWNRWQDDDDSDDEVTQNRKTLLNNFSEFTKTLPSELMEKDFTELFNEDLEDEITDDEIIATKNFDEDSFIDNVDVRNINPEMMSKMEEGLITKKDRESLSSPDNSSGSNTPTPKEVESDVENETDVENENDIRISPVNEDGVFLEDEFRQV